MAAERASVTGGAGFIGSHLVRGLLSLGHSVTVLDDFSTGTHANLEGVEDRIQLVAGDIRDPAALTEALRGASVVFHLAATASVELSIDRPDLVNEVNVDGTLAALSAARDARVRRFIFASSTAVYGEPTQLPIEETSPTRPLSPYGASKLAGEAHAVGFHSRYGLAAVALRFFNVFGARQDPGSPYAAVIPRFVAAFARAEPPTIFGDGEQTRDFIFVEDVVRAILLAAEAPPEADGRAFNIGSGIAWSINEVVRLLCQIFGADLQPIHLGPRSADIRHSVADVEAAHRVLGFSPRFTFEQGLRRTVAWLVGNAHDPRQMG